MLSNINMILVHIIFSILINIITDLYHEKVFKMIGMTSFIQHHISKFTIFAISFLLLHYKKLTPQKYH